MLSSPARGAIVASAINFQKSKIADTTAGDAYSYMRTPKKPSSEQWQTDAWSFYDIVGEFRYGVDWVAALASRVVLTVTKDGEPTTDEKAVDALAALYGGVEGQTDMLRQVTRHWTVAGDCYLVGSKIENPDQADWLVGAATQTTRDNQTGGWKVNEEKFEANSLVVRLWRPHPVNRTLADSPARAALPVLSEIDGLTKHVQAQIDSRLAGAGILFIPTEMSFGSPRPEIADDPTDDEGPAVPKQTVDALVQAMIDTASVAIADRSDPAALVPIIIQADGEAIRNIKYQTFSTDLDKQALELRNEAIRRLALSLDMPPEVLTGTADLNHWSSWQIEEAAIKAHLEPLLAEICASLTIGYLRPALEGKDAEQYAIVADTSALRLRPNRSKEAIELYNLGELGSETMLKENGFDPTNDKMDDAEFKRWVTANIARGSASPEQVQAALDALGIQLDVQAAPDQGDGTREARPNPSIKDHPNRGTPDPSQSEAESARAASVRVDRGEELVKASAVMVHRALERAGNRIKTSLKGSPRDPRTGDAASAARIYELVALDFASMPIDDLLKDAWGTCDVFAHDLGVDPIWLTASLDAYARDLLQHSKPLHMSDLRTHLFGLQGRS